jgi:hypothetical protein
MKMAEVVTFSTKRKRAGLHDITVDTGRILPEAAGGGPVRLYFQAVREPSIKYGERSRPWVLSENVMGRWIYVGRCHTMQDCASLACYKVERRR